MFFKHFCNEGAIRSNVKPILLERSTFIRVVSKIQYCLYTTSSLIRLIITPLVLISYNTVSNRLNDLFSAPLALA